jgi:hypothetical protein
MASHISSIALIGNIKAYRSHHSSHPTDPPHCPLFPLQDALQLWSSITVYSLALSGFEDSGSLFGKMARGGRIRNPSLVYLG